MTEREASTIFRTIQKCRNQALHTNDCGNCERCQYYLEHEQIDGAVALAISALEKQEKKSAKAKFHKRYNKFVYFCPVCGEVTGHYDYCSDCGQAIDYDNPEPYTEDEA
jgi:hypothetical protein